MAIQVTNLTFTYIRDVVTIEADIVNDTFSFNVPFNTVGIPKVDPDTSFSTRQIVIDGKSYDQDIIFFQRNIHIKLVYPNVAIKSSVVMTGHFGVRGKVYAISGNNELVINASGSRIDIDLSKTISNTSTLVTSNDVAQAISNASYIQNVNGDRHFIWDINYSIKNLSSIPLGFKITFLIEFKNEAGEAGTVLQVLKTLLTENGTFHFDIQNNSILTDNTMDLKVLMVSRDDNFAIANPALKRLTLVIDEPTINNFEVEARFDDGHINFYVLTESDGVKFINTVFPSGVTFISSTTTKAVTTTFEIFFIDVNAHLQGDIVVPPPPEPENIQYNVFINLSDSTFNRNFILTPAENQILLAHVFDPLVVLSFPLATTLPATHTAQQMITEIETALVIEPPQAGNKSYTMELKSSSYLATPEGKSVHIQIEVTRIGTGVDNATALLNIKQGLSGISIFNEFQSLQIGGANIFPIVFDIPDVPEATATLDFIVQMLFSETDQRQLTEFPVIGKLIFEAPPTTPPPTMAQGSVMQKILGGLAMLGTTVLLSSKGR